MQPPREEVTLGSSGFPTGRQQGATPPPSATERGTVPQQFGAGGMGAGVATPGMGGEAGGRVPGAQRQEARRRIADARPFPPPSDHSKFFATWRQLASRVVLSRTLADVPAPL